MRFKVCMAVTMKIAVFLDVMLSNLLSRVTFPLKMEAVDSCETVITPLPDNMVSHSRIQWSSVYECLFVLV
jgi:hypothetical protein